MVAQRARKLFKTRALKHWSSSEESLIVGDEDSQIVHNIQRLGESSLEDRTNERSVVRARRRLRDIQRDCKHAVDLVNDDAVAGADILRLIFSTLDQADKLSRRAYRLDHLTNIQLPGQDVHATILATQNAHILSTRDVRPHGPSDGVRAIEEGRDEHWHIASSRSRVAPIQHMVRDQGPDGFRDLLLYGNAFLGVRGQGGERFISGGEDSDVGQAGKRRCKVGDGFEGTEQGA